MLSGIFKSTAFLAIAFKDVIVFNKDPIKDLEEPPTSFSHPRISSAHGNGPFTA